MMTYNRAAFGKNIQEAREMKGWSQTRLAENLHIGKSFVNNWESGF
jgi:ribosome-binding protein aMBF1 (putative translation factor)